MIGELIFSNPLNDSKLEITLTVPGGLYIAEIKSSKGIHAQKLIVR